MEPLTNTAVDASREVLEEAVHDRSVILIGTTGSLPGLLAQIESVELGRAVVGAVVVGDSRVPERIAGCPVLGGLEVLGTLAAEHLAPIALVSVPASEGALRARVNAAAMASGMLLREAPPMADLLAMPTELTTAKLTNASADSTTSRAASHAGSVPSSVRPRLDLSTLIGREPYTLDPEQVGPMLRSRRVLITGAGGSIGSELARIVAAFEPAELAVMDRSENAVFEIDRQLRERHPALKLKAVLHDVTEDGGTRELLEQLRPDVVFHAAAHKHVPLMEDHPYHAVRNNLFGTKAVAEAAAAAGAERFVLISTDKAVRPSSVMGATKRLAELFVQDLHAQHAGTDRPMLCSLVRFGNVLGSAASVLQIWSAQLADGGPITVTDPRMTRYFMTIHEAATLVVQAGAMAQAGAASAAVNVLDMGEPVKIIDLARRFVRAHGFTPVTVGPASNDAGIERLPTGVLPDDGAAVEIVCTGARPGEKLHEELAYAAEHLGKTSHPGIGAWRPSAGLEPVTTDINAAIAELDAMAPRPPRAAVVAALGRYLPDLAKAVELRKAAG